MQYFRKMMAFLLMSVACATSAYASEDQFNWAADIIPGTPFPSINAKDHESKQWTSEKMKGKNGFLLLFNRSVVW